MKLSVESETALRMRVSELCRLRDLEQQIAAEHRASLTQSRNRIDDLVKQITNIQKDIDANTQ